MIKSMKKIMGFLCSAAFCAVAALGMPQMVKAAEVAINETNFPDQIFRNYVTSEFDKDKNGKLSEVEVINVTSIDVDYKEITDLKGIEYFTALTRLNCNGNQLSNLDVSQNLSLTNLYCSQNRLTSIDVSNNLSLYWLSCDNNQLTSIDVSHNLNLQLLYCGFNQLTSIDVSHNLALELLQCTNITSIDVSHNLNLRALYCSDTQLTSIDVSHNPNLKEFVCCRNQLISIDVSKNAKLTELNCSNNQLTSIDISHNPDLKKFYCYSNELTSLKLNKQVYDKLSLENRYLHNKDDSDVIPTIATATLSNLSNVIETNGIIKVTDINKPATYQYIYDGKKIDFTILYIDSNENTEEVPVTAEKAYCTRIFNDYEYKNPVSGIAITVYGNGSTQTVNDTKVNTKEFIAYTDILASYNYSVNNKGKVKASTGKVIAGITMSDTKPTITKNKIVDNEATKIAKAKIKNGQITVTAAGKASGVVYLWVMDTGNKGVSECCPINVKLAPKKLEVQETTGSKVNKLKIANGSSKEIKIAGLVGTTKTEDCTYTATVDSKSQNYVSVTSSDGKNFTLKGTGLKNDKDTKVSITFTCNENGKKVKFTATITKPTT